MSQDEEAVETAEEQGTATAVEEEPAGGPEPGDEIEPEPAVPVAVEPVSGRQARIYLCDRGHRTAAVWSAPSVCHARSLRHGPECGRPLHPIDQLPEQVQKALNPLKASKKSSKKG